MPRHAPHPVALVARLRTGVSRRPALVRLAVLVTAVTVGGRVWSALDAADAARRAWGDTRTVWVVAGRTDRGAPVATRAEQYPLALVPPGALAETPVGARAARTLDAGWVLGVGDLLGDGVVPGGWVVVAVPADRGPIVVEGDRVTLFEPGRALCDGVVTDANDVIGVALSPSCAADAVAALVDRTVVLGRRAGAAAGGG